MGFPVLRQAVLDCTDPRELAEFYRWLLGLVYRPGDESGTQDWLVLRDADGAPRLAFQQVDELPEATWPAGPHPQMLNLNLNLTVPGVAELDDLPGLVAGLERQWSIMVGEPLDGGSAPKPTTA